MKQPEYAGLANKNILLGVTGSIAAYKSAELIRAYQQAGASVRVMMTEAATRFITPLTLQALSGYPVHTDLLDYSDETIMGHIKLARWADVTLIAPASADFIADICSGNANNVLTAVCLVSNTPIFIAPAMNQAMFRNLQTQKNMHDLRERNIRLIGPDTGIQACGDKGPGRMAEVHQILQQTAQSFQNHALAGVKLLITAGATREPIDSVRFITNPSSGKTGFALAQAAVEEGAQVTLVAANVALETPEHCTRINVMTALDMHNVVANKSDQTDIFIASAAVTDFRSAAISTKKIKKTSIKQHLELVANPDILAEFSHNKKKHQIVIGFAAETDHVVDHAFDKLKQKSLDLVIANDVSHAEFGFGSDHNMIHMITPDKDISTFTDSKRNIGRLIIERVAGLYKKQQDSQKIQEEKNSGARAESDF